MTIDVTVTGLENVRRTVINLPKSIFNLETVDEMATEMVNQTKTRFLRSEAPDGSKWIPSIGAQRRAAEGRFGPTLYDTGELFNSIQSAITSREGRIGTPIDFAPEHQFGLAGQEKREFLGFNQADIDKLIAIGNRIVNEATQ